MAENVVISTLLVLFARSNKNIDTLWTTTGGFNDAGGDKHLLPLVDILLQGNFRSVVVDQWATESFESVYLSGCNELGDVFWETEFNATGTTSAFTSWLTIPTLKSSWAEDTGSKLVLTNYLNYRIRITPTQTLLSWFGLSAFGLPYGPLPLIFVPRSAGTPFTHPEFLEGHLGCWSLSGFVQYIFDRDDPANAPSTCISSCWDRGNIAILQETTKCYCGQTNPGYVPVKASSNCYLQCPGNASAQCGGFDSTWGNVYHVQGTTLPGTLSIEVLYDTTFTDVNTTIQIDATQVPVVAAGDAIFFTSVTLDSASPYPTYTISYNDSTCAQTAGVMKILSFDGSTPTVFTADGSEAQVDILRARCVEIELSQPTASVNVTLRGPKATSTFVSVPVLAIQAKKTVPVTTTLSTTTTTPTTTPKTTTTPMTTSTTTTPATTTTTTTTSTTPSTTEATTTATSFSALTTPPPPTPTTTTSTTPTTSSTTEATTTTTSSSTTTSTASTTVSSTSTSSSIAATTTESTTSGVTTASSTPSPSTTTSSPSTTTSSCLCSCNFTITQLNLTAKQLQLDPDPEFQKFVNTEPDEQQERDIKREKIVEIQRQLAVNVSQLSSTIRKLTSADDKRVSAVSIGYVGVGLIVAVVSSIVFIDSAMLFRDMKKLYNNIRQGLCPSSVQDSTNVRTAR